MSPQAVPKIHCRGCQTGIKIRTSRPEIIIVCKKCGKKMSVKIPEKYRYKVGELAQDPSFEYVSSLSIVQKPQSSVAKKPNQSTPKKKSDKKKSKKDGKNRKSQNGKRNGGNTFKYEIPGVKQPVSADTSVYITVSDRKVSGMMAYISSQYPELLSGFQANSTDYDAVNMLVKKVFTDGITSKYILSNLIYEGSDGKNKNTIAIRSTVSGYLNSIIGSGHQMRLFGHIGQHSKFYVEKLEIVRETVPAANEQEVSFQVRYSEPATSNTYIWTLINSIPSYVDGAKDELQHWTEYLDWKQKLTALKICGIKYIGFRVLLDEGEPDGISFLCVSPDEASFRSLRRAFQKERDQIAIYSNQVSKNRWLFNYDMASSNKSERGMLLTIADITRYAEPDYVWNDYSGFARKSKSEETPNYSVSEAKRIIERDRNYPDPKYFEITFEIPVDSQEYIDRNGLYADDAVQFLAKDVFSYIYSDGFIATSRIGDFALNNRLKRGLSDLRTGQAVSSNLGNWIFDITKARSSDKSPEFIAWSDWGAEHLNPSQKQVVQRILSAPDVFLCQGPPGTGKTTVIAETVYQLTQRGQRVIIASQTNLAVNNALSKLLSYPSIRAIRLGAESKIDDSVEAITDQSILRTFFTGVRDDVVKKYLKPWHLQDEQIAKLQQDRDYATELLRQVHKLSDKRAGYEIGLRKVTARIEEMVTKTSLNNGENNEYKEYKATLYQSFAGSLRNGRIPAQKAQITTEQAEALYQKLKIYIQKLYQAGYRVLPEYTTPDDGFRSMTAKEVAFAIIDLASFCLMATYGLQADAVSEKKDDTLIRKLKIELRELEESDDDSYETFQRLKEIKAQLKQMECGTGQNQIPSSVIKMLPENLRHGVDVEDICNQLKSDVEYAAEIITVLANFYDQLGCELHASISAAEEELKALRARQGEYRTKLDGVESEIAETTGKLDELLQQYESTESNILSFLDEQIKQIKKMSAELDRDDFSDFISGFVDYVDSVENDYSLENEIYLTSFVNACNVVGISCTESSYTLTEKGFTNFDVAIIDEVSKATPPEILLPLLLAEKAVLVGDHRQLPPLFGEHYNSYQECLRDLDEEDVEGHALLTDDNFTRFEELVTNSLFKRHYEQASVANKGALLTQYRMHREIMDVVNIFYDGKLESGYSVEDEAQYKTHHAIINSAYGPARLVSPEHHAYWIDTSSYRGRNIFEENKGTSKYNRFEAFTIVEMLRQIDESYSEAGVQTVEVGVISFYAEQVRLIRELVRTRCRFKVVKCDINTVDRFQGKEKKIVVVSLVRNVPAGRHFDATFVKDYRRINVAMSRAQALLLVVGAKDMYAEQEIVIENMDNGKPLPPKKAYRDIIEMLHMRGCYIMAEDVLGDTIDEALFPEG